MSLRDQVLEDLKTIFNLDEMASEHSFAGRVLQLVVDNDQLQKNALQAPRRPLRRGCSDLCKGWAARRPAGSRPAARLTSTAGHT